MKDNPYVKSKDAGRAPSAPSRAWEQRASEGLSLPGVISTEQLTELGASSHPLLNQGKQMALRIV